MSLDRRRGVWQPPLNPAAALFVALARAVLTLVEFTQAARVAEGADRPRLPAAPALHPTLCRPDLTPRSLRRSAAPEPLHNPGKREWEEGGCGGKAATFPVWHVHAHTFTQTWERCGRSLFQFLSAAPHCFPFFRKEIGTFTILLHMLPSVQGSRGGEGGGEAGREAESR